MSAVVFFAVANDGIGKVDRSTLSQQTLMELFIFGLDKAEKIYGSRDAPGEVCEWNGVTCNAGREVVKFRWAEKSGTGTLGFEFLPDSMENLNMSYNALSEGGGDGAVASAGLRAQRRSIAPRSRRLAGHRPDGWPSLDGGSV
ncbi:hypothetical protein XU18_3228 [Perkinsela sp. CCAP 1560/4]|nr:hypothetical protein XU18_3228 [Perkinsela sp. CCAP 1560/4]|eukprot:KNH05783.1 hypothetical protein XU18_3228 [Perkinsela sp. CCAP 1560/4]